MLLPLSTRSGSGGGPLDPEEGAPPRGRRRAARSALRRAIPALMAIEAFGSTTPDTGCMVLASSESSSVAIRRIKACCFSWYASDHASRAASRRSAATARRSSIRPGGMAAQRVTSPDAASERIPSRAPE